MPKKTIFIIIGVILCISIVTGGIYLKMKHDEKENKKQFTIKNSRSVLRFISSIILKNPIPSKLYISLI